MPASGQPRRVACAGHLRSSPKSRRSDRHRATRPAPPHRGFLIDPTCRPAGLTAVAHKIAGGSVAACYPEANVLIALDHYDAKSGTPSYKSIPVQIRAAVNRARRKQSIDREALSSLDKRQAEPAR
jgi:hypothetical protein